MLHMHITTAPVCLCAMQTSEWHRYGGHPEQPHIILKMFTEGVYIGACQSAAVRRLMASYPVTVQGMQCIIIVRLDGRLVCRNVGLLLHPCESVLLGGYIARALHFAIWPPDSSLSRSLPRPTLVLVGLTLVKQHPLRISRFQSNN